MARRRRKRTGRNLFILPCAAGAVAAGMWWTWGTSDTPQAGEGVLAPGPAPVLTTDRPEILPDTDPKPGVWKRGAAGDLRATTDTNSTSSQRERAESLLAAGDKALSRGDPVAARTYFGEAVTLGLDEPEAGRVRAELTRVSKETILSPRIYENDPRVERYIIKPGDALAKVAQANRVSADLLAAVNEIANQNLIRAGRSIKVVKGPFRAVIDRSAHSLDVYLGDTLVARYRVGLGADGSTPAGEWRVKSKLRNPTYYPPRGGRIIAADDPKNPLGERWIGLEGVAGEALGQERYGIHGTIEPESIGHNSSMGCIRLFNEDVETLFMYLVLQHSTVTIR